MRQIAVLVVTFVAVLMGLTAFSLLLARRAETSHLLAESERLGRITAVMSMRLDGDALAELCAIIDSPVPAEGKYAMIERVLGDAFGELPRSYPGTFLGLETAHDGEIYVYGPHGGALRSTTARVHRILIDNRALLDRVISERKFLVKMVPGRLGGVLIDARPVETGGRVIGVLWAMRPTTEIVAAGWRTRVNVGAIIVLASILTLVAAIRISRSLILGVERLKRGLAALKEDLGFRFAPMSGELGEVAAAINKMADSLQHARELEEEARRNQRLVELGRLVAGVAHGIRNPLTSIQGYVQYWARRPDSPPSPSSLQLVVSETTRLNKLVERLLYFARPLEARYESQDIEATIAQVVDLVAPECETAGIEVKRGLSGQARQAEIDGEQIRQVVLNLVMNAIQAMPSGGTLSVRTSYGDNEVELEVADTGPGIPLEQQESIFTPFFTTKRNGAGLGLAISREIARAHGGSMGFRTEPGRGTAFYVRLPYVHGGRCDGETAGADGPRKGADS